MKSSFQSGNTKPQVTGNSHLMEATGKIFIQDVKAMQEKDLDMA